MLYDVKHKYYRLILADSGISRCRQGMLTFDKLELLFKRLQSLVNAVFHCILLKLNYPDNSMVLPCLSLYSFHELADWQTPGLLVCWTFGLATTATPS
jgi:hypothetical protein